MPADWATAARERTIQRLASILDAGIVTAHPENAEECRWCDYAGACRVEQAALIQIAGAHD
jgi:hypothetical protein